MKIGLNADLLERLGKVKLIKDKNGTVKNAIFSDELVNYIKAKRDQNHETYIFFSNPQEMTLKERAKTKRRIFKKYQLEPKYQPRLVFTTESDYNNAIDRNAISIDSGDVYSSFEELISILEHQKELMEAPILHPSTPSCGVPSKDAFWRKYQTAPPRPRSYPGSLGGCIGCQCPVRIQMGVRLRLSGYYTAARHCQFFRCDGGCDSGQRCAG